MDLLEIENTDGLSYLSKIPKNSIVKIYFDGLIGVIRLRPTTQTEHNGRNEKHEFCRSIKHVDLLKGKWVMDKIVYCN